MFDHVGFPKRDAVKSRAHAYCYGAFVFDPDGHDVEAVCHTAESA